MALFAKVHVSYNSNPILTVVPCLQQTNHTRVSLLKSVQAHASSFPQVISYNCFVELGKEVAISLALFIKKVLLGKCTGISFVDSPHSTHMKEAENTYALDI